VIALLVTVGANRRSGSTASRGLQTSEEKARPSVDVGS
jgi:hypothetical protein